MTRDTVTLDSPLHAAARTRYLDELEDSKRLDPCSAQLHLAAQLLVGGFGPYGRVHDNQFRSLLFSRAVRKFALLPVRADGTAIFAIQGTFLDGPDDTTLELIIDDEEGPLVIDQLDRGLAKFLPELYVSARTNGMVRLEVLVEIRDDAVPDAVARGLLDAENRTNEILARMDGQGFILRGKIIDRAGLFFSVVMPKSGLPGVDLEDAGLQDLAAELSAAHGDSAAGA